ncbi:MAG: ABC transporter permease [Bdellovibrionales bacterium]|nr:ABC transporter permease [Bdellovibrionales bacterium]
MSDRGAFRHLFASPWTAWMGGRYLRSKKSSRWIGFVTMLSMGGVAIGVTAVIVVLCVMDGFEKALWGRLVSSEVHVLVEPSHGLEGFAGGFVPAGVFESTEGAKTLAGDARVVGVSPIAAAEAILRTGRVVSGVVVKGVDEARLARLRPRVVEALDRASLKEEQQKELALIPGMLVGRELAYNLGLIPGDFVTIVSPTELSGPLGSVPRVKRFFVEGVFESGQFEEEVHTVFTRAAAVHSFLRRREVVSQWEITLADYRAAPEVAKALRSGLPGFRVRDWMQLNSSLFASLKLERVAMFVILIFIVIVASFNIVTTLSLAVIEKKREIAILKAMGARHGQVGAVFLSQGLFIGVVGAGVGLAAATVICLFLSKTDLVQLPDVYYDRTLPVSFVPGYFAGVTICALLITLVAGVLPARRAVKLHPLDGIRGGGA